MISLEAFCQLKAWQVAPVQALVSHSAIKKFSLAIEQCDNHEQYAHPSLLVQQIFVNYHCVDIFMMGTASLLSALFELLSLIFAIILGLNDWIEQ